MPRAGSGSACNTACNEGRMRQYGTVRYRYNRGIRQGVSGVVFSAALPV